MDLSLVLGAALVGAAAGPALNRLVAWAPQHSPARTEAPVAIGAGGPPAEEPGAAQKVDPPADCTDECRTALPHRRLFLSVLTSGICAAIAGIYGLSWWLLPELALAAMMLPLAFCDYEHLLLPRRVVWPGTAAVIVGLVVSAAGLGHPQRLLLALACGGTATLAFGLVWLANPRWMALGDVRLALPMGLALGWLGPGPALLGFLLANLASGAAGLMLLILRRVKRSQPVPFGVFLAAGAIAAMLIVG